MLCTAVTLRRLPLLLLAGTLLMLQGCGEEKTQTKKERSVRITTTAAIALEYAESTTSLGRIESRYPARVAAMIAGRVSAIHAEPGDRVNSGDLLAELELTDSALERETAAAKVRALEASLNDLQQRLLTAAGTLAEELRKQIATTEDELNSANIRKQLTETRQARTRILSPVTGIVDSRETSPGEYLRIGDPLFQVTGTKELRARLPLPQALAERLQRGQKVELKNLADPERTLETSITEIRPRVGEESRAVEVLVEFENPGNWKPGTSLNARIILEQPQSVVAVPEAAAVLRPAGTVVYLIDGDRAKQRVIEPGPRQDGMLVVRTGLSLGDVVAVTGAGFLSDGAKVSIQNTTSDSTKN
jgi:RND family efflux transporter MFP subunit